MAIAANSLAVNAEGLCYMAGYGIQSAAAANLRVIMVPDLIRPNLELRQKVITVQSSLLEVKTSSKSLHDTTNVNKL